MTQQTQQEQHKQMRNAQWADMWESLTQQGWKTVPLWPEGQTPNFQPDFDQVEPRMILRPAHAGTPRGVVLILAGGGFRYKTFSEATATADHFYAAGMNTAILDYRVLPYTRLDALCDAKRAVRLLRLNAGEYGFDPAHIALCGFSAGGILTAMSGAFFDYGDPDSTDPAERVSCRPDAAVVCYGSMAHAQAYGILGYDRAKQNELARFSAAENLPFDAPPFFLFQTAQDDPRHCLKLGMALATKGIPFEVHLFKDGAHGHALFDGQNGTQDIARTKQWAPLASSWLTEYGF